MEVYKSVLFTRIYLLINCIIYFSFQQSSNIFIIDFVKLSINCHLKKNSMFVRSMIVLSSVPLTKDVMDYNSTTY
jgi:hypothetical protein